MIFSLLVQKLGSMTWPLLTCSFLTVLVLLERAIYLIRIGRLQQAPLHRLLPLDQPADEHQFSTLVQNTPASLLWQGISLLITHRQQEKPVREELVGIWLYRQRRQLSHWVKLLPLMGTIAPLLGLLGTILGLITMFQDISTSTEPVTPSLLADGLGVAMYTTAAGLFIALPALVSAHLLYSWIERILSAVEMEMNHYNLWLEGVTLQQGVKS